MTRNASIPKFGVEPNYNFFLNRYSNVSKVLSSTNQKKAIGDWIYGRYQVSAADGDKLQMFFICDGTETKLEISTRKQAQFGIFDLYINGVLDSSGYDDYAAVDGDIHREITLTQTIVPGMNTIELRVNGKNAASSGYFIEVYGASLQ